MQTSLDADPPEGRSHWSCDMCCMLGSQPLLWTDKHLLKHYFSLFLGGKNHYMCHGCLCWRCTRARNDQRPDIVLLCRVLLMQVWPNVIYYWGRLCSAVPTGGGPYSAGTRTLAGAWRTGVQLTKLLGGQIRLLALDGFNLGFRLVGANPIPAGDLVWWTKR